MVKKLPKTLWCILLLAFLLRLGFINYGLPDDERLQLHFSGRSYEEVSAERLNVYRVLNSSYSDEADIIGGISNMNPRALDFNPQLHFWGHFHFYVVSAAFVSAAALGIISFAETTKNAFFQDPQKMTRLYQIGRFVSVAMATLTVLFVFLFTRRLWGTREGLLAATFLAVTPIHFFLSKHMTFDVPMIFWASVAIYFLIRYDQEGNRRDLYYAAIFLGITAGTKYHGLLLLPGFFYAWRIRHLTGEREKRGTYVLALCLIPLSFFITNPYLLLDWKNVLFQNTGESIYGREVFDHSPLQLIWQTLDNLFIRSRHKLAQSWGSLPTVVFIISALVGIFRDRKWGIFFFLIALPVLFFDSIFRASVLRYLLLTTVFLLPLAAHGLCYLRKHPSVGKAVPVLIIAVFLNCLWIDFQFLAMSYEPNSEHVTAKWIQKNIPKGSQIGVHHRMFSSPPIDWDFYDVKAIAKNPFETLKPDFFVLLDLEEHASVRQHLESRYEEITKVGRYPGDQDTKSWRRAFFKDLGEYQHFQPRYVILKKTS